ncbi:MAG: class II aldolase/adducin family protein [Rhodothermia bacterium]|nr:class II aldolase/adducin family protein [Rhodothermia bacterium]
MIERGVIQFECRWTKGPPPDNDSVLRSLIAWRQKLIAVGLMGVNEDGIGFGNISVRHPNEPGEFVVTGSQTGAMKSLTRAHLSVVTDFSVGRNWVACRGPVRASSESLTHGIVYRSRPDVSAVIHVHNEQLWTASAHMLPRTPSHVEAGTPEMANELARVMANVPAGATSVVNMGGHKGGLIALGPNLDMAGQRLIDLCHKAGIDAPSTPQGD